MTRGGVSIRATCRLRISSNHQSARRFLHDHPTSGCTCSVGVCFSPRRGPSRPRLTEKHTPQATSSLSQNTQGGEGNMTTTTDPKYPTGIQSLTRLRPLGASAAFQMGGAALRLLCGCPPIPHGSKLVPLDTGSQQYGVGRISPQGACPRANMDKPNKHRQGASPEKKKTSCCQLRVSLETQCVYIY
jgi:hypothetical protein